MDNKITTQHTRQYNRMFKEILAVLLIITLTLSAPAPDQWSKDPNSDCQYGVDVCPWCRWAPTNADGTGLEWICFERKKREAEHEERKKREAKPDIDNPFCQWDSISGEWVCTRG